MIKAFNLGAMLWWLLVWYMVKTAAIHHSETLFYFSVGLSFYLAMFEYPVFSYIKKNNEEENVDDEEL